MIVPAAPTCPVARRLASRIAALGLAIAAAAMLVLCHGFVAGPAAAAGQQAFPPSVAAARAIADADGMPAQRSEAAVYDGLSEAEPQVQETADARAIAPAAARDAAPVAFPGRRVRAHAPISPGSPLRPPRTA